MISETVIYLQDLLFAYKSTFLTRTFTATCGPVWSGTDIKHTDLAAYSAFSLQPSGDKIAQHVLLCSSLYSRSVL